MKHPLPHRLHRIHRRAAQSGFSLLELLIALGILSAAAYVALDTVASDTGKLREDQTRAKLEQIRKAVVGDPNLSANGQPLVSGFVADVGRLPECLDALLTQDPDCNSNGTADGAEFPPTAAPPAYAEVAGGLSFGWRGPYISGSGPFHAYDGWRNEYDSDPTDTVDETIADYGWDVIKTATTFDVISSGLDRWQSTQMGAPTGVDADNFAMEQIAAIDFQTDLSTLKVNVRAGVVSAGANLCVAILMPDSTGTGGWVLTESSDNSTVGVTFPVGGAHEEEFDFTGTIPIGTRRVIVYEAGTAGLGAGTCTPANDTERDTLVGHADLLVSRNLLVIPKVDSSTTITLNL